MRNHKKILTILLAAIMAVGVLSPAASAETIYEYGGFRYTIINNTNVSVCGWDDRSADVEFPRMIGKRHLKEIDERAFMGNTFVTSVDFSEAGSLDYIGSFAFSGCTSLDGTLTIPRPISYVDTAAFEDCSSIDEVVITAGISAVPAQCFNRCASLKTATLNSTVKSIGNYAFAECSNLEYIVLGKNITSIASSAFKNDSNLTIGCYTDSAAHHYAEERGIPYVLLDAKPVIDSDSDSNTEQHEACHIGH